MYTVSFFVVFFFFSSRRRHTRFDCDWSSDVCSSDLNFLWLELAVAALLSRAMKQKAYAAAGVDIDLGNRVKATLPQLLARDRKSTRLNSSHSQISYAVFCLKKKNTLFTINVTMIDIK